jgi:protein TonB
VYPALARQARVQGTVVLAALIAPDGRVRNLRVLSGHPLLTQAALEAVRHWRYEPTLLNGDPMEVDTTVQVIFRLQ